MLGKNKIKNKLAQEIKKKISGSPHTKDLDPLLNQHVEDRRVDRNLRRAYAIFFIWILIGQLFVMNFVFIGYGFNLLKFTDGLLKFYLGGTLAEVFGIVVVITKYLFPGSKKKLKKN